MMISIYFSCCLLDRNKGVCKKRRTSDEIQKITAFFQPRREDTLKNLVKLKNTHKNLVKPLRQFRKKSQDKFWWHQILCIQHESSRYVGE